jgi:hypothetical protein
MRLGTGRANQFGSCPKLPTWTKPTSLSLAHSFKPRSMAIILLSNSGAGSAILGGSFILFRLGIALPNGGSGNLVPNRIDGMDKLGCYVDQARLNGRTLFAALYRLAIPPRTVLRPHKVASKQRALGLVPSQPSNFKRPAARRFIDSPSRVQRRTLSHHRHINNRCPVTEGTRPSPRAKGGKLCAL